MSEQEEQPNMNEQETSSSKRKFLKTLMKGAGAAAGGAVLGIVGKDIVNGSGNNLVEVREGQTVEAHMATEGSNGTFKNRDIRVIYSLKELNELIPDMNSRPNPDREIPFNPSKEIGVIIQTGPLTIPTNELFNIPTINVRGATVDASESILRVNIEEINPELGQKGYDYGEKQGSHNFNYFAFYTFPRVSLGGKELRVQLERPTEVAPRHPNIGQKLGS